MNKNELQLRNIRRAPFFLAVLCFFAPFLQGDPYDSSTSITGIQLATGFKVHSQAIEALNQYDSFNPYAGNPQSPIQNIPPSPFIMIAMACAVLGGAFSHRLDTCGKSFPARAGWTGLGAIALVKICTDYYATAKGIHGFEFSIGFYLAGIFLLTGALIASHQYQLEKKPGMPAAAPARPLIGAGAGVTASGGNYYYAEAQAGTKGPFNFAELLFLERTGVIVPGTNIIVEGGSEWTAWSAIKTKAKTEPL